LACRIGFGPFIREKPIVADFLFLFAGIAAFALFGVYARLLRRI
jgi:hypothetical protein